MVLVDTSVWIGHFREGNERLKQLLLDEEVLCHPFIIGELACGNLANRSEILSLLHALPKIHEAEHHEVLQFVEKRHLMGKGLGYIDLHLLASAVLANASLWTFDKRLRTAAISFKMHF